MPIYLPQIPRREFLKRALLASAGVAIAPAAQAGWFGKARDKHTFAFFSDAHVAADAATLHSGVNMAENLAAAVRELLAWPVRPETVIVNGDLAFQNGLPGEYATFGEIIEPVRALAPMYLSVGNHDGRQNFWQAFPHDAAAQKATLQRQATVFSSDRANWFQLDSLDVTATAPGELGVPQVEWLARELAARPDKPAIIVVHHNLESPSEAHGLKDTAALETIFSEHPQVKACIYGHTHNWHVAQHATGVHLINLPPTAYVFKEGRPSGWVWATLTRDGAEFELRSLDQKHPEHGQIRKLTWRAA
jgi:predicted phosphodiesterase